MRGRRRAPRPSTGRRDTRKIDAVYNLTGQDVRGEARFGDSIGIYPEFIDWYGVLILPTTGRYLHPGQLPFHPEPGLINPRHRAAGDLLPRLFHPWRRAYSWAPAALSVPSLGKRSRSAEAASHHEERYGEVK